MMARAGSLRGCPLPPPPSRKGRGRSSGDIGVAPAEWTLHSDDIHPTAELDASCPHGAHHVEAKAGMHADRAGVLGVADHRDDLAHARSGGVIDQARNQCLANTLPADILANVHAV